MQKDETNRIETYFPKIHVDMNTCLSGSKSILKLVDRRLTLSHIRIRRERFAKFI